MPSETLYPGDGEAHLGAPSQRQSCLPEETENSGSQVPGSAEPPQEAQLRSPGSGVRAPGKVAAHSSLTAREAGGPLEAGVPGRPLRPPGAQLPDGGASAANFSLLGAFLGLVARLGGPGSRGRGSRSFSSVPSGSGVEEGWSSGPGRSS